MGRRALRTIDPNLDLSAWAIDLEELPRPATGAALFGRDAPLEVEVGSGKGLFLRTAAVEYPQRCFLGSEVVRKYARFTAAGLAKRELTNAKIVVGDALRLFAEWLPDRSVAAVHVYFPDPWWKKRHRKRRVMRESFVRDVQRVLEPGGVLHFWTDVAEYFQASLETLAAHTTLDGPHRVDEMPAEHEMDYRTHFERRMRKHEEEVFRSEFRKA
ncbi:MAG: tRNA (guanosine(46)-N7)-methyltransferase TrmB [Thermoguttaceae bacterium]|jgi:tRNA (guanine-N7-)-methyltransferase|nr:tRNA (guanosine(46)-N7)-methyltransferase TrmB [Thermoguttaceae bacterium]